MSRGDSRGGYGLCGVLWGWRLVVFSIEVCPTLRLGFWRDEAQVVTSLELAGVCGIEKSGSEGRMGEQRTERLEERGVVSRSEASWIYRNGAKWIC